MTNGLRNPFNRDLESVCRSHQDYRKAEPFPHCLIDGLISEQLLEAVLDEFPPPVDPSAPEKEAHGEDSDGPGPAWINLEDEEKTHRKQISSDARRLGFHTRYLAGVLNSSAFLTFLERLTGIEGLIPDPHLYAGGLHQIASGGFLELHTDFHWSSRLRLYRRINVILYLNREWNEDYRGHLELWDRKLEDCVKLLPSWNRMVISDIGPHAYHGFPEPIQCPADMTRKSLALWYYTRDLPPETKLEYLFHEPDWVEGSGRRRFEFRAFAKKVIPPLFQDLLTQSPRELLYQCSPPILSNLLGRRKV